jgi:tetratricopeptide (TPR) repeat protein
MAAAAANQLARACDAIERALAYDGVRAEYHAHYARCLVQLGRQSEAKAAALRALELNPSDALTLDTVGVVLARLGAHESAAVAFERAVASKPGNASYLFNLGASLRFLGRFDEAEDALERAIAAEPRFHRAHSVLADLRKQTPERNHVERLIALLPRLAGDADAELHVCHALSKEYEDLGDYENAFAALSAGKAKKRAALGYSFESDRALFAKVQALFPAELFGGTDSGDPTPEPIFVLGMPRSGTTLVERILSSHSDVLSAGELPNFAAVLRHAARTPGRALDPVTLENAAAASPAELGRSYLESTRPITGTKPRFVDKMPLNFWFVGLIARALPNAKIVALERDPLDTCVSNYRQLFSLTSPEYAYAYDLRDLGRYYAGFRGLMAHWDAVLPGRVLSVRYEDLVADQEGQTRRLLEYCGLKWQDACLAFHENPAAVATASAVQVRSPLYKTSIGRWRHYAAHLDPLRAELAAAGLI